ncbi:MAG: AAA family ATPase [Victivallaceae bacterium]|nr:AAA family ATPase [Victivallaceae bacterium]
MKHYREKKSRWQRTKALTYFFHFIDNHRAFIEDDDVFNVILDLKSPRQWLDLLDAEFPHREAGDGFDEESDFVRRERRVADVMQNIWNVESRRSALRDLLKKTVADEIARRPEEKDASDPFAVRTRELQKMLKLSDLETEVLLVVTFIGFGFLEIADGHHRRTEASDKTVFIAKCLDRAIEEIDEVLSDKGKLRRLGCLDEDNDLTMVFRRYFAGSCNEPLANQFFRRVSGESLPWEFYGELAEKHGAMLKRILSAKGAAHILLYGAPGTGKTSFARTLAAELKRDCFFVEQHVETRSGSSTARFGALKICDGQVDPASSIIVVDEADAMLCGARDSVFYDSRSGDKGMLNSVLDELVTPTIWISNTPAFALDESSRRRFDYSIRFEPLSNHQRLAVWRNNVRKMKLGKLLNEKQLSRYATRYPVSAGGITLILQNLVKLAPDPGEVDELVEKLMKPHCELLGISTPGGDKNAPAKDYSLQGINIRGAVKLDRIIEAVRRFRTASGEDADRPRMNLLLSGPPGTGKTEFVKYLGSVLETKITVRMGSDLLDKYVGGTEANIRRAFDEAAEEKSILFLDEIDGLVQSRSRAQHSWEVSQVNELLHQMEVFDGVMIGATNFAANLDPAILRRFTFKLEFDYLDEAGKMHFFETFFGRKLQGGDCARLAAIPALAPGDFRTVRQSFFYLDEAPTERALLDALEAESAAKRGNRDLAAGKVGF